MKNYEQVIASSTFGYPNSIYMDKGSFTKFDSLVKSVYVENVNITAYQV